MGCLSNIQRLIRLLIDDVVQQDSLERPLLGLVFRGVLLRPPPIQRRGAGSTPHLTDGGLPVVHSLAPLYISTIPPRTATPPRGNKVPLLGARYLQYTAQSRTSTGYMVQSGSRTPVLHREWKTPCFIRDPGVPAKSRVGPRGFGGGLVCGTGKVSFAGLVGRIRGDPLWSTPPPSAFMRTTSPSESHRETSYAAGPGPSFSTGAIRACLSNSDGCTRSLTWMVLRGGGALHCGRGDPMGVISFPRGETAMRGDPDLKGPYASPPRVRLPVVSYAAGPGPDLSTGIMRHCPLCIAVAPYAALAGFGIRGEYEAGEGDGSLAARLRFREVLLPKGAKQGPLGDEGDDDITDLRCGDDDALGRTDGDDVAGREVRRAGEGEGREGEGDGSECGV
eukprot:Sspe_Gene.15246::Locus_5292_Transcript_1_1_Confidence_1.000_Length_1934::g.15246::m.15246